jgi:hypothetical protein
LRNESFLDYHSKRFRNVGMFKKPYQELLNTPEGMYALDYIPPGK